MIRCPGTGDAIAVTGGQVSIDGVVMRVTADLTAPVSAERGGTFAIDVEVPASGSDRSPAVECVRMRIPKENTQWDAVPTRINDVRDGTTTRVRATGGEGPHWRLDEKVEVIVWLKTAANRRHVLNLGAQPARRSG